MKDISDDLNTVPNVQYQKFFNKFDEIKTLEIEKWKSTHILAYFCDKYYQIYQTKYSFKFNTPSPSKCFEVFQVKKLANMLSSDPKILKDYIDWVYQTRVINAKRKLTSISFMTVEGLVNEYKNKVLFSNKAPISSFSRSTLLPEKYQLPFTKIGLQANTYGDLSFIKLMDDKSPEILQALEELQKLGFDLNLLDKIV